MIAVYFVFWTNDLLIILVKKKQKTLFLFLKSTDELPKGL